MSQYYVLEIFLLFVAFCIYKQVKEWASWRALKRWGKENGCEDVFTIKNNWPWGIDRYWIMITGIGDLDFLEDIVRARYIEMKTHTMRTHQPFNTSTIFTSSPLNIQAVLATKFEDYAFGPARKENLSDAIGNAIFTAEGAEWGHFRAQLRPQFARSQVSDLDSAQRHLDILWKALPAENDLWVGGKDKGVDLLPFLYRFTMDVSTEFLFGSSVESQSHMISDAGGASVGEKVKEDMEFSEALAYMQEYIAWRVRLNSLYWLARSKKYRQAIKTIRAYGDKFVKITLEKEQKAADPQSGGKEKFVLLDALVAETRDPVELRDQIVHVLLAGRDTTSALLCWVFLLLAKHPSVFDHLRGEIISTFGEDSSMPMTFESLKACKFLQYVIFETLRLYPLVPGNGRVAIRDTVLPEGGGPDHSQPIALRKGEAVMFSIYVSQRRHDLWGEDADEFKPERWEGRKLGWDFVPFSGGPRICLGQQYALNEAGFVVARFLQRYDKLEYLGPEGRIAKRMGLTVSPKDGVKVRLHRAESSFRRVIG
ncbi:cytochrome P450 alkane hydroxylase-like protein [Xylogone sp. PMI_703]|nr:cytochrome P450 alkane hydroxylase-like protein [Xylogone sp. PMI_703]